MDDARHAAAQVGDNERSQLFPLLGLHHQAFARAAADVKAIRALRQLKVKYSPRGFRPAFSRPSPPGRFYLETL